MRRVMAWPLVARLVALALLAAAAVWLVLFIRAAFIGDANVRAKLGTEQADAAIASGTDAVETVGQDGARQDRIDAQVKGIDNDIDQADDAGAADAAARDGLCLEFGLCD